MITVVTLNPALDITHEVERADWAGVNRPHAVHVRPGGKGVNVARTLRALGADVTLTGLAGGGTGRELAAALAGSGISVALTEVAGQTRRTFAVVDSAHGRTALFNEPGPAIGEGEYAEFGVTYSRSVAGSAAVVLSGSLPPGLADDTYAHLIAVAARAGVPVILDTSGIALRHGAAAGPALVKPNLAELEDALEFALEFALDAVRDAAPRTVSDAAPRTAREAAPGQTRDAAPRTAREAAPGHTRDAAPSAAREPAPAPARGAGGGSADRPEPMRWAIAQERTAAMAHRIGCGQGGNGPDPVAVGRAARELAGPGAVVVTMGHYGLVAVTADGAWHARPARAVRGNPTGAGDAVVAALAHGLVLGRDWPDRLRHAAALGAAAAAAPVAGDFLADDYRRQLPEIQVTELPPADLRPAQGRPGTRRPGTGQPGARRPGTGQPGARRPGTGQPGSGQPGARQPDTARPDTGQPDTARPDTGRPGPAAAGTGRGAR